MVLAIYVMGAISAWAALHLSVGLARITEELAQERGESVAALRVSVSILWPVVLVVFVFLSIRSRLS